MERKITDIYLKKLNDEKNALEGLLKNKIDSLHSTCEDMQNTTPWSSLDFDQIFQKPERITVTASLLGGLAIAALGCVMKKSILKGIGTGCILFGAGYIAKEEGLLSCQKLDRTKELTLKNLSNCTDYVSQEVARLDSEVNSHWKSIIDNLQEKLMAEINELPIKQKMKDKLENIMLNYSMNNFSSDEIVRILRQSAETGDIEMYKSVLSSCFNHYTTLLNKNYEKAIEQLLNLEENLQ